MTKQELAEATRLYKEGVSCVRIAECLWPQDRRPDHLKRQAIAKALKKAGVKMRTPRERTLIGRKTRSGGG